VSSDNGYTESHFGVDIPFGLFNPKFELQGGWLQRTEK
jgi:hypothetical protein